MESKGNEIMYATGALAFLRLLFLLFAPFYPRHPPLFHLSNLNAYRRLSSPRLAVLSAEITSALTDLWEARSKRPVVKPRRHVTYTSQATRFDEYSCFVNFLFFFFFETPIATISSRRGGVRSALSFGSNEVRYRGIRNSIERYPPRGEINKAKDAYSGLREDGGESDGGEIRGSGRRAKIKKRRREERRGRKPDELSSPRASVEDTRGESASKLLLIIARTTRLLSLSLSVCVSLLFPSSSPLSFSSPFFAAPLTLYLAASCCFDTERGRVKRTNKRREKVKSAR